MVMKYTITKEEITQAIINAHMEIDQKKTSEDSHLTKWMKYSAYCMFVLLAVFSGLCCIHILASLGVRAYTHTFTQHDGVRVVCGALSLLLVGAALCLYNKCKKIERKYFSIFIILLITAFVLIGISSWGYENFYGQCTLAIILVLFTVYTGIVAKGIIDINDMNMISSAFSNVVALIALIVSLVALFKPRL